MSELLDALILPAQAGGDGLQGRIWIGIVALAKQVKQQSGRTRTSYPFTHRQRLRPPRAVRQPEGAVQGLEDADVEGQCAMRIPPPASRPGKTAALARGSIAVRSVKKADWRGNRFKEREVRNAIRSVLGGDAELIETIFAVAKAQGDY